MSDITMRDASKKIWTSANTVEHINCGSLQRIADAVELMARRYSDLITERDVFKERADRRLNSLQKAERRISALRGVITKLKARNP